MTWTARYRRSAAGLRAIAYMRHLRPGAASAAAALLALAIVSLALSSRRQTTWAAPNNPSTHLMVAAGSTRPQSAAAPSGDILCAYWREIPGSTIADLTSQPSYPYDPSEQVRLNRFEIPENQEGNFGTVIRGWVHPPMDGSYIFYIAGNNQCELQLSSDDQAANKKTIASVPEWSMPHDWTASPKQHSSPIALKAGRRYYIEALQKNGGGDNNLSVAWKLPNGLVESPIPGNRLSAAEPVIVAPPRLSMPPLPISPGSHRLTIGVDYRAEHLDLSMLVTLPPGYRGAERYPALVFLADTDLEPDNDGFYLQGPDRALLTAPPTQLPTQSSAQSPSQPSTPLPAQPPTHARAQRPISAVCSFIGLSPQLPSGRSYDQRVAAKAVAAAIVGICKQFPVDQHRIALVGSGAGGTAAWQLALQMPGFYSTLTTLCAHAVDDPRLPKCLNGTRIRIITNVDEGYATDCANHMSTALSGNKPAPQVVYLTGKELGSSTAADYCYNQPVFFNDLLSPGTAKDAGAQTPSRMHLVRRMAPWIIGAFLIALAAGLYIRRRGSRSQPKE